ncbi:phosphatase PAP2 family protein [Aeromicrobium sp. CF4.19]|uniref:phosphatase PAP2 family protein n=1 Tax=Aeromicrobium sp. CF4.19 TaxID=3373082 RepID=UPI003EE8198A
MSIDLRRATPGRPGILLVVLATLTTLLALLALAVGTGWEPLLDLDEEVAQGAYELSSGAPWLVGLMEIVALVFGNWPIAGVLAVTAGIAFWRREWRIGAWVVLSTVAALLGNVLLKLLFTRERPFWDEPLHEIGGYSFPSGHSAGAGLFVTVLVLLTIVQTGRGWRRRLLITLWVAVGILVAASRVLLGVHFLSDVTAGLAFGIVVTLALWLLVANDVTRLPAELAMITGTGRRAAAVVLNPAKVGDVEDFKSRVRLEAERQGWNEPLWFETSVEDPGHGQATAALEAGVDLIIAAGGDGTVRAVCEEAARTGVAVGIIPHGTGNLLARNLGVPLNARDALQAAFGGQDKAIDLASYSTDSGVDTVFLVMAGLGMDAMIMTGVDDRLKEKVGWAAYFVSGLKALRFPGMKVEISVDDEEPRKFRARTVVIGNVGFLQGGIPLLPDARIDDGKLDVVVLAPRRFFGWLGIVWRVVARRKRTNERLDRFTGSRVHVKASSPTPMQLDGDPVGEGCEITAEVHPGVLLVRVPVVPVTTSV